MKKRILFLAFVAAVLGVADETRAQPACIQLIRKFNAQPGADYLIKFSNIDNRAEVLVNGMRVFNEAANGSVSFEQNISTFLSPHVANTVVIKGINQAYPGGHGGNPGELDYTIVRNTLPPSTIVTMACPGPDWRGGTEQLFVTHTYEITVP
jgi:hypothetical protein